MSDPKAMTSSHPPPRPPGPGPTPIEDFRGALGRLIRDARKSVTRGLPSERMMNDDAAMSHALTELATLRARCEALEKTLEEIADINMSGSRAYLLADAALTRARGQG